MLPKRNWKRETKDGIKQPNQENIKTEKKRISRSWEY